MHAVCVLHIDGVGHTGPGTSVATSANWLLSFGAQRLYTASQLGAQHAWIALAAFFHRACLPSSRAGLDRRAFPAAVNEDVIRSTADKLVQLGLRDAGYVYLNIDGESWHCYRTIPQLSADVARLP
jgi:hypothetical protein